VESSFYKLWLRKTIEKENNYGKVLLELAQESVCILESVQLLNTFKSVILRTFLS
jgi:hypothetical protein